MPTYEIPQNLKYEEKIIANLNFAQLFWVGLFFGSAAMVILSEGIDWGFEAEIIVGSLLMFIGLGFAFFDFWGHLMSFATYMRSIHDTEKGKEQQKLEQFMEVERIENGIVYLKNGGMRALVQVLPINFTILSDTEQQAVISAYRAFLNSLDFPVQIVMRTVKMNLDDYLTNLRKGVEEHGSERLLQRFYSFREFLQKFIEKNNVKNRLFYVVVPFDSLGSTPPIARLFGGKKGDKKAQAEEQTLNKEYAFNQLDSRVRLCMEKLRKCGLTAHRLPTEEINQLLSSYFEDTGKKKRADWIKPTSVKNEFNAIRVNDEYNRVVSANAYPRLVREGWLNPLILAEGNFDLSMYINPTALEYVLSNLNRELIKQESDMLAAESKGLVNPLLKVQYNDTYRTLEKLQKGEEKLFDFAMYVNVKAKGKRDLDLLTRRITADLNSILVIPRVPWMKMQQAMQSVYPVFSDKLGVNRNIPSNALAACFPFTSSFLNFDDTGVMFAVNKENKVPIILDVYNFVNYNGLVLGTSGGGKSYAVKLYILRNFLKGIKTMVIDPQGEYSELIRDLGGEIVEISRDSESIINPLDLMGADFGEKMLALMDLFKIMFGGLSEEQKNILDKAVLDIYEDKGIIANDTHTWDKTPPILGDLLEHVRKKKRGAERDELRELITLENRLHIYTEGAFGFLNRQTQLDFSRSNISFNIEKMPKQVKPIMMFLILEFIVNKMREDKSRKLLVVDEAWSLLRHGEQADYLFELIKTSRKYGLGLVIITQEVTDLLTTEAGGTILANTSWKMLLRQEPAVIKTLAEKFNLNVEEENYLLTADIGEGLLFAMNEHIPIRIIASDEEHELITTNPDELDKRERLRKDYTHGKSGGESPIQAAGVRHWKKA